ncbi:toxin glutamine deamidase domain-containing protein [Kitasatospora sp. HPMI-4]|uniref:WXG100-like domain-containing protein n=1 Tax=Kitasatospora sp. HPMI-4 TaxID=3448443 RepID=UPI003F1D812B
MAVELPEPLQWVLLLLAGTRWPEADEGQLRDMADHCRKTATNLLDATHAADAAVKNALEGQQGVAAEGLAKYWAEYSVGKGTETEPGYLPGVINALNGMGDMLEAMANSAETAKIQIIAQLGILAFEIATAEAEAVPTFGASMAEIPVFITISRETVQQVLKKLLMEALQHAVKQAVQMAAINLIAQTIELAEGHRKSIDMKEVGQNALGGAVAGATGNLLGKGIGKAGEKAGLEGAMGSTVGKVATGAAVGVGTDAITQLVTTGKVDSSSLLGSGLSGGAGVGVHAGASALKGHSEVPKIPSAGEIPGAGGKSIDAPTFSPVNKPTGVDSYHGPTGSSESAGSGGSKFDRPTPGGGDAPAPRPTGLVPFGSDRPSSTPLETHSTDAPRPYEAVGGAGHDAPPAYQPVGGKSVGRDAPPAYEPMSGKPVSHDVPPAYEPASERPVSHDVPPAYEPVDGKSVGHDAPPAYEPVSERPVSHDAPSAYEPVGGKPVSHDVPPVYEPASDRLVSHDAPPAYEPTPERPVSHDAPPAYEPVGGKSVGHDAPPAYEPASERPVSHDAPPAYEPMSGKPVSHDVPPAYEPTPERPVSHDAPPAYEPAPEKPVSSHDAPPAYEAGPGPSDGVGGTSSHVSSGGAASFGAHLPGAVPTSGTGSTHLDGTRLASGPAPTRTSPDRAPGFPDGTTEQVPPADNTTGTGPAQTPTSAPLPAGGFTPGPVASGGGGGGGGGRQSVPTHMPSSAPSAKPVRGSDFASAPGAGLRFGPVRPARTGETAGSGRGPATTPRGETPGTGGKRSHDEAFPTAHGTQHENQHETQHRTQQENPQNPQHTTNREHEGAVAPERPIRKARGIGEKPTLDGHFSESAKEHATGAGHEPDPKAGDKHGRSADEHEDGSGPAKRQRTPEYERSDAVLQGRGVERVTREQHEKLKEHLRGTGEGRFPELTTELLEHVNPHETSVDGTSLHNCLEATGALRDTHYGKPRPADRPLEGRPEDDAGWSVLKQQGAPALFGEGQHGIDALHEQVKKAGPGSFSTVLTGKPPQEGHALALVHGKDGTLHWADPTTHRTWEAKPGELPGHMGKDDKVWAATTGPHEEPVSGGTHDHSLFEPDAPHFGTTPAEARANGEYVHTIKAEHALNAIDEFLGPDSGEFTELRSKLEAYKRADLIDRDTYAMLDQHQGYKKMTLKLLSREASNLEKAAAETKSKLDDAERARADLEVRAEADPSLEPTLRKKTEEVAILEQKFKAVSSLRDKARKIPADWEKKVDKVYEDNFKDSPGGRLRTDPHSENVEQAWDRKSGDKPPLQAESVNRNHIVADTMLHKYMTSAVLKARALDDVGKREATEAFGRFTEAVSPDGHRVLDKLGREAQKRLVEGHGLDVLASHDLKSLKAGKPDLETLYGTPDLAKELEGAKGVTDQATAQAALTKLRESLGKAGLDGGEVKQHLDDLDGKTAALKPGDAAGLAHIQGEFGKLEKTVNEKALDDLALVNGVVGRHQLNDLSPVLHNVETGHLSDPGTRKHLADKLDALADTANRVGYDPGLAASLTKHAEALRKGEVPKEEELRHLADTLDAKRDGLHTAEIDHATARNDEELKGYSSKFTRANVSKLVTSGQKAVATAETAVTDAENAVKKTAADLKTADREAADLKDQAEKAKAAGAPRADDLAKDSAEADEKLAQAKKDAHEATKSLEEAREMLKEKKSAYEPNKYALDRIDRELAGLTGLSRKEAAAKGREAVAKGRAEADLNLVGAQYGGAFAHAGPGKNHPATLFEEALRAPKDEVPDRIAEITTMLSNSTDNLRLGDEDTNKWIQNFLDPQITPDEQLLTAVAHGQLPPEVLYTPHTQQVLSGLSILENAQLVPTALREMMAPKTHEDLHNSPGNGDGVGNVRTQLGVPGPKDTTTPVYGRIPVSSSGEFTGRPDATPLPDDVVDMLNPEGPRRRPGTPASSDDAMDIDVTPVTPVAPVASAEPSARPPKRSADDMDIDEPSTADSGDIPMTDEVDELTGHLSKKARVAAE